MKVIIAQAFANGVPCPHAGQYIESFDFEAHGGRGYGTFTKDPAKALRFKDAGAAMDFWRTQSKTVPHRPYGDFGANRPLTAVTVEIVDAP